MEEGLAGCLGLLFALWIVGRILRLIALSLRWLMVEATLGEQALTLAVAALVTYTVVWFVLHIQRRKRREAEAKKRKEYEAQQQAVLDSLASLLTDSRGLAGQLHPLIRRVNRALDLSESEFAAGVFAPFWDAIENAARTLAEFHNCIGILEQKSLEYKRQSALLDQAAPSFDLGIASIPDSIGPADRLRQCVRTAQRDFHFSTIYEQRRTNQILVEGFKTLEQAIDRLGGRLVAAIERATCSIMAAIETSSASRSEDTARLRTELQQTRQQLASDSRSARDHEAKSEKMLDNIQRGRPPGLLG